MYTAFIYAIVLFWRCIMSNTYENMVKIENIKDEDEKNALMRLVEVGVTPIQLLSSESKQKNDINQIIGKSPYSKMDHTWIYPEGEDDGKIVVFISTNLRVVYEHYKELYDEIMEHDGEPFDFEDEDSYDAYKIRICRYDEYPGWFKKRITIKFTMDSHSAVIEYLVLHKSLLVGAII